jgi:DNA-binding NtrC family response regulator
MPAKVLVIDDDVTVAKMLAEIVEFCGHAPVLCYDSLEAASRYVRDPAIAAVMTDYLMPRLDGLELLSIFLEQRPRVRRVLVTAAPQEVAVRAASNLKLVEMVIAKPPTIADVRLALAWL